MPKDSTSWIFSLGLVCGFACGAAVMPMIEQSGVESFIQSEAAYHEGYKAAERGEPSTANPYTSEGSTGYQLHEWQRGWDDAMAVDKQ